MINTNKFSGAQINEPRPNNMSTNIDKEIITYINFLVSLSIECLLFIHNSFVSQLLIALLFNNRKYTPDVLEWA